MIAVIVLGALVLAATALATATAVLSAANRELRASCAHWEGAAAVMLRHPTAAGMTALQGHALDEGVSGDPAMSGPLGGESAWPDPWFVQSAQRH